VPRSAGETGTIPTPGPITAITGVKKCCDPQRVYRISGEILRKRKWKIHAEAGYKAGDGLVH
jgi:hypothetical protein